MASNHEDRNMKWSVGRKIGSGFGLALVLLFIVGAASYDNITRLVETADIVAHTHLVRVQISTLVSHLEDAETGQRGYVLTGEDRYLEPYQSGISRVNDDLSNLRNFTVDNPAQQGRIADLSPLIDQKLAELKETIDLRKNKGFDAARQVVLTNRGIDLMDRIRKLFSGMDAEESNLAQARNAGAEAAARNTKLTIILVTVLSVVVLLVVTYFMTRNIAVPLQEITRAAEKISTGELSFNGRAKERKDEIGALDRAFDRMTQSLLGVAGMAKRIAGGDLTVKVTTQSDKDVLGNALAAMLEGLRKVNGEIREGVQVVGSSASEILAATTQVAAGAAQTATAVAETMTTVEEVKQTAELASRKAKHVSETAQKTAQISEDGKKSVETSIEVMNRIHQQMESIAESIVQLSDQSRAIGEIISTVNDLAEQSNLLAVNAAIEAARAGEQGKGFGVVAQEIKSLAEQSKKATAQVRTILNDIQKATSAAAMATEKGSKTVEAGVQQSANAGESIRLLAHGVEEAALAATQIAASSQQQLAGMDQVAIAIENILQASTQNAASTKQAEGVAQNLHELGQKLKEIVEQYTV
jgi:methyl-accepting chemotaxis protein